MNILFVCTGNTCRSPIAEALMKARAPHLQVRSAGIYAFGEANANDHAITALKERNIKLAHRSQLVTEKLLYWADLVLTMTVTHKQLLNEAHPAYEDKVFTLKEYALNSSATTANNLDVNDPFGGDLAMYKETLQEIDYYIEEIIVKI